jgi:tetratricopeptide (TPR) repeat protein
MSRSLHLLLSSSVLLLSGALAAVAIWHAERHGVSRSLLLGVMFTVLGATALGLRLTLSDATLRRHFGWLGANPLRELWWGGWFGVALGATQLGVQFLDGWVQATAAKAQFIAAFNRGEAATRIGDWQRATEAYSEAIRLDPGDARPYRHRAATYLHQRQADRALADLDEAIRLAPGDARAVYNRGVAFVQKNDLDRALAEFGEAIRLNPTNAKAYLARSGVYRKKGDDARASADQRKAAQLDPTLDQAAGPSL